MKSSVCMLHLAPAHKIARCDLCSTRADCQKFGISTQINTSCIIMKALPQPAPLPAKLTMTISLYIRISQVCGYCCDNDDPRAHLPLVERSVFYTRKYASVTTSPPCKTHFKDSHVSTTPYPPTRQRPRSAHEKQVIFTLSTRKCLAAHYVCEQTCDLSSRHA